MFDIKEEVRKLPERPGVYIMKEDDTILYVGKAVNLRNRVRQYFQSPRGKSAKIRRMVSRVKYFEYIVTDSEIEALVLENHLIKEHRPPYNTMLKDDKQYPYIKVTVQEPYPRIYVTRTVSRDKARYFGPYTNVTAMRETLEMLNKIWALRRCRRVLPRDIGKERPCLNYHIGQCMGPCTGKVSEAAYRKAVDQAIDLLNGHYQDIAKDLSDKMYAASEALDFETAAVYRDRIQNLKMLTQKQKIDHAGSEDDRDVIALAIQKNETAEDESDSRTAEEPADAGRALETADDAGLKTAEGAALETAEDTALRTVEDTAAEETVEGTAAEETAEDAALRTVEDTAAEETAEGTAAEEPADSAASAEPAPVCALIQTFFIRGGKLIGREHFFMEGADQQSPEEIITAFIQQFYSGTPYIPKELLIPMPLPDQEILEDWLSQQKEQSVHLIVPQRGEKAKLLNLAAQNAELTLSQFGEKLKNDEQKTRGALKELSACIGLSEEEYPERIEAYDISNTFGYESVGSMIVFEDGRPKNSDYRKFRIQTVQGANDYASLEEVLTRRFRHAFDEMRKLSMEQTDFSLGRFTRLPNLILMDGGKGQVSVCEKVLARFNLDIPVAGMVKDDSHRTRGLYYKNREYTLANAREAFHLITRIQDEAHRFAITYHKKLRSEAQVASLLDQIPSIGPKRRKDLLQQFGSVDHIRRLSIPELLTAPSMNRKAAEEVYSFFHPKEDSNPQGETAGPAEEAGE